MLSIVIFFLIFIQNLYGRICYSNGLFTYSRNDFNWNNFSNILNTIENKSSSNHSSCHVRITIDYNNEQTNYVNIRFNPSTNHHIQFGSTINIVRHEIKSIVSYLDYTCSDENLCEKIFLDKWARQLLSSRENSLHTSFTSSWNSSICHSDRCQSYLCFMIYEELKNLSYGNSHCHDRLSTSPVNIHIKTTGDYAQDYQCTKNHCTNEVIFNSTSEKNSTKIQTHLTENNLIFIRTIIIVGILLFIGSIAYYIQCRKYQQGYRLTINA
jgi:hypothetical protein